MRKIRFWFAVLRLFLKKFIRHIVVGLVLGLSIFMVKDYIFALSIFTKPEKVGILGRFTVETLPPGLVENLSSGLTTIDQEGIPQPGLAQNWEEKENGKIWTFHLKRGLKWQDNSAVSSQNIKYNFPDISLSYPNQTDIEFHLKDSYAAFPVLVSRPVFKSGLLGTDIWLSKRVTKEGAYVKELLFENQDTRETRLIKFYETEQMLREGFALGEIDTILDISDPKDISTWNNTTIESNTETNRFVGVFFNTTNPELESKTFRQVLAYAIDKQKLGKTRALSPIAPTSWAFNPLVKPYDYDTTHAKQLLGQLKPEEKPGKLQLVTIPSLLATAENIADDWRALGIKVTIQVSAGVPHDFQALLATLEIPPDPDQYSLWHSTQKDTNITKLNNPRIDKLLEDGRQQLNREDRKRTYLDFQRFLVEEAPAIFLYHPESYTVKRK